MALSILNPFLEYLATGSKLPKPIKPFSFRIEPTPGESWFRRNYHQGLLLGLLAVAAGVRIFRLGYQGLWVDEIATMNGSDPDLSIASVLQYSVGDQPPSFFLLLHGWLKIFPFTDLSGRWLAALLGVAGVYMIYFLGKEVRDARTGLIASCITTFCYIHIYFSQEVRFYTLVFLATTGSFLYFIKAIRTEKFHHYAAYIGFTTLLIYTHYYGLVVIVSQGIVFMMILLLSKRAWTFFLRGFLSAVVIVSLIAPWIPIFFSDIKTQQFWIPAEPFYFPVKYFYVYFKDVLSCVLFGSILIYYLINAWKKYRLEGAFPISDGILISCTFLGYFIPVMYSVIQTPMLQERYTLVVVPNLIVMISIGITLIPRRYGSFVLGVSCISSLLTLVFKERFYDAPRKEEWRGIVDLVIRESTPNQQVVSRHAWYCNYYFKSRKSDIRALLPAEVPAAAPAGGYWYLDGFDLPKDYSPIEISWAEQGYSRIKTDSLHRARATLYRLENKSQ